MPMGNINQLSAGELRTTAAPTAIEPSPNMDSEENDSIRT